MKCDNISLSKMQSISDSLTSTEGDHGEMEEKLAKVSEASPSPSPTDDPPPIPTPAYLQKHHHSIVFFSSTLLFYVNIDISML